MVYQTLNTCNTDRSESSESSYPSHTSRPTSFGCDSSSRDSGVYTSALSIETAGPFVVSSVLPGYMPSPTISTGTHLSAILFRRRPLFGILLGVLLGFLLDVFLAVALGLLFGVFFAGPRDCIPPGADIVGRLWKLQ